MALLLGPVLASLLFQYFLAGEGAFLVRVLEEDLEYQIMLEQQCVSASSS